MIELFINLVHIEAFCKKEPVLGKVNYQGQNDLKILVDPKKYIIIPQGNGMVLIKRKKIKDIVKDKKSKRIKF